MSVARLLRGEVCGRLAGLEPGMDTAAWLAEVGTVIKQDPHSLVALAQLDGQYSYLKFYRPKGVLQRLQFGLGRGRAVLAFDNARRLAAAGMDVPRPLACAHTGDGLLLVTEGLEGAKDIKRLWQEGQTPERLIQLMTHAGAVLAGLHEAGYSHGDCKWSNFLVAGPLMYLLDLEAVQAGSPFDGNSVRDIARFTLNAEDMGLAPEHFDAFLETYAEDRAIPRSDIVVRMQPLMQKLRARHLAKYGERGHQLV